MSSITGQKFREDKSEFDVYELPDGQKKTDEDDPSLLPTVQQDMDAFSQEMLEVDMATRPDGYLRGTVKAILSNPGNSKIVVLIDLPAEDDLYKFSMNKPKIWTKSYEFVRFVEGYGYASGNFALMAEEQVKVKVDEVGDGYELVIPTSRLSYIWKVVPTIERLQNFSSVRILMFPVFISFGIFLATMIAYESTNATMFFLSILYSNLFFLYLAFITHDSWWVWR